MYSIPLLFFATSISLARPGRISHMREGFFQNERSNSSARLSGKIVRVWLYMEQKFASFNIYLFSFCIFCKPSRCSPEIVLIFFREIGGFPTKKMRGAGLKKQEDGGGTLDLLFFSRHRANRISRDVYARRAPNKSPLRIALTAYRPTKHTAHAPLIPSHTV